MHLSPTMRRIVDLLEREERPLLAREIATLLAIPDKTAGQLCCRLRRGGVLRAIRCHSVYRSLPAWGYVLHAPPMATAGDVEPLEDDGWQPAPWRHPYARGAA